MEKVYVMDNRGRETEAFKIRYFEYQGIEYFIYSLGEIDKDEYVRLYLKKLIRGEEQFISEDEWVEIRNIIQKVVKEIKSGSTYSFRDLNMANLNEIMETDTRVFKLKKSIVEQIIYEEPRVEIKEEKLEIEEDDKEEKLSDTFIDTLEDSIKTTFSGDTPRFPKVESHIRPSIEPKDEYKEKYENLQKEMDEYKVIIYKLKEENTILKKKVVEYHERVEKIKATVEDI